MTAKQKIGTLVVFAAMAWVTVSCNDGGGGGRTPTAPGIRAQQAGALAERSGNDDGDGRGGEFELFGNARMTRDPENPSNVVLEVNNPAQADVNSRGHGAGRDLNVKIWQLDHQLNLKWAFVAPHSCGGGSPRMVLLIDSDGDGEYDFAANGHVRPPIYAGCETSAPTPSSGPSPSTLLWRIEDLTDELPRWEITGAVVPGIPSYPYATWDALEAALSVAFPRHRVVRGMLLEDYNISPPGIAYYDLITIYDLTLGTRGQVRAEREHDRND